MFYEKKTTQASPKESLVDRLRAETPECKGLFTVKLGVAALNLLETVVEAAGLGTALEALADADTALNSALAAHLPVIVVGVGAAGVVAREGNTSLLLTFSAAWEERVEGGSAGGGL